MNKWKKLILVLILLVSMVVFVTSLQLSGFTEAICLGFIAGTCAQLLPEWRRKQKIIAE